MMPVWSWVLIWTILVAGLAGMLVWFAVRLFRKLMRTLSALEDLGDQVAQLNFDVEVPSARLRPAIFRDRRALAAEIERARLTRAYARATRRDLAITRGKLLKHTPYKPEDRPSC